MTEPTIEELEPTPSAAPVARPVASRGRVGLRWIVALVVVALVLAATAAGAWYLAGSSGDSTLAGWAPADSIAYAEARLDLPGDQRQQLGNVLAHFPGFKDQSILDDKIAEAFDRAIRQATSDKHDYSTEIRPWFGGEIAVTMGPLGSVDAQTTTRPPARVLLLASTKDRAATDAWVTKLAADSGTPLTTDTYKGVTLRTGQGDTSAVAVLDRVLLAGDSASVRAAIDTGGTGGVASNEQFRAASQRLTGDHLAAGFMNLRAYLDTYRQAAVASGASPDAMDPTLLDLVPGWVAWDVRATNGDAITGRSVVPHLAANPLTARGQSGLTAHIPGSAFAVVDAHEYGSVLKHVLDTWRSTPSMASAMKSVDQALGFLGGEDAAIGWIGEIAIVGARDGDGVTAGLLVSPKDRASADSFARQVRNLIALGGGSAGVTSHDEDHNGTTVTIVDAGDAAQRLGAAASTPLLTSGRLEIAFAVRDDLVAVGPPAFVTSALDASGGNALAADARFSTAIDRVAADSPVSGWVDVTAIRGMIEARLPAGAERDRYERDLKPYATPFDMLAFGAAAGSDVDAGTFTLITK
jgi:Protein of unknown function (DUF3352)